MELLWIFRWKFAMEHLSRNNSLVNLLWNRYGFNVSLSCYRISSYTSSVAKGLRIP